MEKEKKKGNCITSSVCCVEDSVKKQQMKLFLSATRHIFLVPLPFPTRNLELPMHGMSAPVTFHRQEGWGHRIAAHKSHPAAVPGSQVLQQQQMPASIFKVNHLSVFRSFGRFIVNQPVVIVALRLGKVAFKQGFPSFHGFHVLQALDDAVLGWRRRTMNSINCLAMRIWILTSLGALDGSHCWKADGKDVDMINCACRINES